MSRPPDHIIGQRIARFRTEGGFSQRQLAQRTGLSPDKIFRMEHAKRSISDEDLLYIASALGMKTGDFTYPEPEQKADPITKQITDKLYGQDVNHFSDDLTDEAFLTDGQIVVRRREDGKTWASIAEELDKTVGQVRHLHRVETGYQRSDREPKLTLEDFRSASLLEEARASVALDKGDGQTHVVGAHTGKTPLLGMDVIDDASRIVPTKVVTKGPVHLTPYGIEGDTEDIIRLLPDEVIATIGEQYLAGYLGQGDQVSNPELWV